MAFPDCNSLHASYVDNRCDIDRERIFRGN